MSFVLQQLARRSSSSLKAAVTRTMSHWSSFEMGPPDAIIGLNEAYNKDDYPKKVIIGVGAYRDDAGKPYVLPCVREAERIMMDKNLDMEYSGIVSIVRKHTARIARNNHRPRVERV